MVVATCVLFLQLFDEKKLQMLKSPLPKFDVKMFNFKPQEK
jgi:hypothetical protein